MREATLPVRIVYAGALSLDTMYTKEFASWVITQQENVCWDIFSYNITPDAKLFLLELNAENIRLYEGFDYDELSSVLQQYDIGVILYKGLTPNYIYNAPNKLFEYFACGLDVWFPIVMQGCIPYITDNTFPQIIPLNMDCMQNVTINGLIDRKNKSFKPSQFYCEGMYYDLAARITN